MWGVAVDWAETAEYIPLRFETKRNNYIQKLSDAYLTDLTPYLTDLTPYLTVI